MPQYLSPGVYVEEIPSAVQAIAGVGTSTAGFIGSAPATVITPRPNPRYDSSLSEESILTVDLAVENPLGMTLAQVITLLDDTTLLAGTQLDQSKAAAVKARGGTVELISKQAPSGALNNKTLAEDIMDPATGTVLTADVAGTQLQLTKGHKVTSSEVQPIRTALNTAGITEIAVQDAVDLSATNAVDLINKILVVAMSVKLTLPADTIISDDKMVQAIINAVRASGGTRIQVKNSSYLSPAFTPGAIDDVKLCTSFSEFKKHFGDFSADTQHNLLVHAVYGFFLNGGTRCYVACMRKSQEGSQISQVLEKFAAIDEIAIIAAPGITDEAIRSPIVAHCAVATQDRLAIFDSPEKVEDSDGNADLIALGPSNPKGYLPRNSDYAAFYFPWLQVFDPASKAKNPKGDGRIWAPPSGHIAGIYARVDTNRGVHKAPANEAVMGALGLKYKISKAQQDGLNPQGVNCIRELNGSIRVWGARTIGGDANGEWRYINVRRTFLYLRESIDEGTQWAVFEPNDQNLWAKLTRNVSAFLTTVWRSGALFGATAADAFYVKCDAETNPPELREVGQVVTEIGVAVVRPAEFVIFRISQWQPQGAA